MSISTFRRFGIVSISLVLVGTLGATAWLLRPTWEAYREQVAFEQAVQKATWLGDDAVAHLSSLSRQSGLPKFVVAEIDKDRSELVPFYLRASWYCLYRGPRPDPSDANTSSEVAAVTTKIYRLEIPTENYQPRTKNARKLVTRQDAVDVKNTPSGPVEEPALPLHGEEARRVAFMWDFYEMLVGRAGKEVAIENTVIRSDVFEGTVK
jgi:hypothetical protein